MEQAQYWLWMKRREILKMKSSSMNHYYYSSWEEKAFAEDAAAGSGSNGGCVWPPRSYSCSFCKRDFRSAQALGGHMNVHRRDRARLKQSLTLQNDQVSNNCPTISINVSPIISRVSSSLSSTIENLSDQQNTNFVSSSCSDHQEKYDHHHHHKSPYVETNLSVGLNSCSNDLEAAIRCKRIKTSRVSTLPSAAFFPSSSSSTDHHIFGFRSSSHKEINHLDLELRLGVESPKVK